MDLFRFRRGGRWEDRGPCSLCRVSDSSLAAGPAAGGGREEPACARGRCPRE